MLQQETKKLIQTQVCDDNNSTRGLSMIRQKTHALAEGPTPLFDVVAILMTGARIPATLLRLAARASPVPRCGAGKTYVAE